MGTDTNKWSVYGK